MIAKFKDWLDKDFDFTHHTYIFLLLACFLLLSMFLFTSCGILLGKNPSFSIWQRELRQEPVIESVEEVNPALEAQEEPKVDQECKDMPKGEIASV
jgi:hypothetical protein